VSANAETAGIEGTSRWVPLRLMPPDRRERERPDLWAALEFAAFSKPGKPPALVPRPRPRPRPSPSPLTRSGDSAIVASTASRKSLCAWILAIDAALPLPRGKSGSPVLHRGARFSPPLCRGETAGECVEAAALDSEPADQEAASGCCERASDDVGGRRHESECDRKLRAGLGIVDSEGDRCAWGDRSAQACGTGRWLIFGFGVGGACRRQTGELHGLLWRRTRNVLTW
jgi:hypothetical protein